MDSLRSFAKSSADRLRASRAAESSFSERPEDAEVVEADGAADGAGDEKAKKARSGGGAFAYNIYVALAGGYGPAAAEAHRRFATTGRFSDTYPEATSGPPPYADLHYAQEQLRADQAFADAMAARYREYVAAQKAHNPSVPVRDMEDWQRVDYAANRDFYSLKEDRDGQRVRQRVEKERTYRPRV